MRHSCWPTLTNRSNDDDERAIICPMHGTIARVPRAPPGHPAAHVHLRRDARGVRGHAVDALLGPGTHHTWVSLRDESVVLAEGRRRCRSSDADDAQVIARATQPFRQGTARSLAHRRLLPQRTEGGGARVELRRPCRCRRPRGRGGGGANPLGGATASSAGRWQRPRSGVIPVSFWAQFRGVAFVSPTASSSNHSTRLLVENRRWRIGSDGSKSPMRRERELPDDCRAPVHLSEPPRHRFRTRKIRARGILISKHRFGLRAPPVGGTRPFARAPERAAAELRLGQNFHAGLPRIALRARRGPNARRADARRGPRLSAARVAHDARPRPDAEALEATVTARAAESRAPVFSGRSRRSHPSVVLPSKRGAGAAVASAKPSGRSSPQHHRSYPTLTTGWGLFVVRAATRRADRLLQQDERPVTETQLDWGAYRGAFDRLELVVAAPQRVDVDPLGALERARPVQGAVHGGRRGVHREVLLLEGPRCRSTNATTGVTRRARRASRSRVDDRPRCCEPVARPVLRLHDAVWATTNGVGRFFRTSAQEADSSRTRGTTQARRRAELPLPSPGPSSDLHRGARHTIPGPPAAGRRLRRRAVRLAPRRRSSTVKEVYAVQSGCDPSDNELYKEWNDDAPTFQQKPAGHVRREDREVEGRTSRGRQATVQAALPLPRLARGGTAPGRRARPGPRGGAARTRGATRALAASRGA